MQAIIRGLAPDEIKYFNTISYTIGGMMLWPGKMIGGQTINQTRGSRVLYDRFDLTVECIRRHYAGDTTHPLAEVLGRYLSFFDLFLTFDGSIDFWLLDDVVDVYGNVKLSLPSEDFTLSPLPESVSDYLSFRDRTVEFVTARNERIRQLGL